MANLRLKECRESKGLKQKDIATLLGILERSYQHYEHGSREPKIDTLIKLADFYGVNMDYLVGRSDNPERAYEK